MHEIKATNRIWKASKKSEAARSEAGKVPRIYKCGQIMHISEPRLCASLNNFELFDQGEHLIYIIMPRLYVNLDTLFRYRMFSKGSILSLGI